MYVNKCSKCGADFETKNPKRIICPDCLYPDRNPIKLKNYTEAITPQEELIAPKAPEPQQNDNGAQGYEERRPYQGGGEGGYRRPYNDQGGERRPYQGGGEGGYRRPYN
ncbi:MAG: hypothetical protein WCK67_07545, partial [bacterium]